MCKYYFGTMLEYLSFFLFLCFFFSCHSYPRLLFSSPIDATVLFLPSSKLCHPTSQHAEHGCISCSTVLSHPPKSNADKHETCHGCLQSHETVTCSTSRLCHPLHFCFCQNGIFLGSTAQFLIHSNFIISH